jgi:hypothetical protein
MTLERTGMHVVAIFPIGEELLEPLDREDVGALSVGLNGGIARRNCDLDRLIDRKSGGVLLAGSAQ